MSGSEAPRPSDPLGLTDPAVDPEHPWPGLAPFTEESSGYFHGRDEEVEELCRRVRRKALTVLFGQSGLGKTSILRAGLVPRLRPSGFCPVYVRVSYAADAPPPAEQVKQAILHATGAAGEWTRSGIAAEGESLWEFLHHRDDRLRTAEGQPVIPLLILDQFEEIFTLAQADDGGKQRAARFLEELADLVENRPPHAFEARLEADDSLAADFDFDRTDYRVLIALREDYLAFLEPLKLKMPSVAQNRMRLARMTGTQALAAVLGPGGHLLDREVAESIVRFVAGGAELRNADVEPALLSLICRRLNGARLAQGRSAISAGLLEGSRDTLLADFYERALADQPPGVRRVIEQELLTDSGYRESLAEERVQRLFAAAGGGPGTLATLVNRRLLRIEERLDSRRVELTHDVLCGVVKASRAQRQALEEKAEAERQLADQAAKAEEARRALRRARAIAVGCAALALVAVGGAVFGIVGARRAAAAEAKAVEFRKVSESSRTEAEKLVGYLLDDLYEEVSPIGRFTTIGGLARKAVDYYDGLPPAAQTPETRRNSALARVRLAQTLADTGGAAEAQQFIDESRGLMAGRTQPGGADDQDLITTARIAAVAATLRSDANDFAQAATLAGSGLAALGPMLKRDSPPPLAVEIASELNFQAGFATLRSGRAEVAVQPLAESRRLLLALGRTAALEPRMAAQLSRVDWVYAEALTKTDRSAEGRSMARESVEYARSVLASNPAHRPAIRALASATRVLADMERNQLRFDRMVKLNLESIFGVERTLFQLEPKESRNNLRLTWLFAAFGLLELGKPAEAWQAGDKASETGALESFTPFSLLNLVAIQTISSYARAQYGNIDAAARSHAAAERTAARFLERANEPLSKLMVSESLAWSAAWLRLAREGPAHIEGDIAKPIAERAASGAGLARTASPDTEFFIAGLHGIGAEAALMRGDHASAERHARAELAWRTAISEKTLLTRREANEARIRLALALAHQGNAAAATETLKPALGFFDLPEVRASDSVLLHGSHAKALLAQALATPARKAELLTEARRLFALMPASTRMRVDMKALGAQIERAAAR